MTAPVAPVRRREKLSSYSASRCCSDPTAAGMFRHNTMSSSKSTAYWLGFNLASQAITRRYPDRSLFLRYEDFIADPPGTIDSLLRLCGVDPAANPLQGRSIELRPNHTVTGNPDRFRSGATIIRDRDDSWKHGLSRRARLAATALSWPLLRRYGYADGGSRGVETIGSRA